MEPAIAERDSFTVVGVVARGDASSLDFAAIWTERFMAYYALLMPRSSDKACYGVSFATERAGIIDYVAGMAVDDVPDLPEGLVVREVLAARYAVFRCTVNTIGETYERIFKEWLPSAQCQHDPSAPAFEFYPPGTVGGESPVQIHIPLR